MKITPENYKAVMPDGFKLIVRHLSPEKKDTPITNYGYPRKFGTEAFILKSGTAIHGYGYSICHPNDQINKRKGWEIAVGRAFKNAGFI